MEVAAAAIGVVNATVRTGSKVYSLCESWKDAPRDVQFLRNSLEHAGEFLSQVQERIVAKQSGMDHIMMAIPSSPRRDKQVRELEVLLRRGETIMAEIESIVQGLIDIRDVGHDTETKTIGSTTTGSSRKDTQGSGHKQLERGSSHLFVAEGLSKRRRIGWLTKAPTVAAFRNELKDICSMISANLISLNLIISMDIFPSGIESNQLVMSQIKETGSFLAQSISQSKFMALSKIEQRLDILSSSVKSHIDVGISSIINQQPAKASSVRRQSRLGVTASQPLDPADNLLLFSTNNIPERLALARRTRSSQKSSQCGPFCSCRCHHSSHNRAASSISRWELTGFDKILGSATLKYSGYFTRGSKAGTCTSKECQHYQPGEMLQLYFQFPVWLVRAVIYLYFSTRITGVPELLIRVYNSVGPEKEAESIIGCIWRSDLVGLRRLLRSRKGGSIHDSDVSCRRTPLHLAITKRNMDMSVVRLLMQAGADPFQEDGSQRTPTHLALEQLEKGIPSRAKELADILPVEKFLEDNDGYTVLHKIILGLLPLDLEQQLQKPEIRSLLEVPSDTMRTPLHLAALRGDVRSTRLLLSAGANLHARRAGSENTAVHEAAAGGKSDTLKLLIDAGADANARTWGGTTTLHLAVSAHSDSDSASIEAVIRSVLYRHGADINALNGLGHSVLLFAVIWGSLDALNFLLDHGANVDQHDAAGDVALSTCIRHSRHEMTTLLLGRGRGADYTLVNNYRRSLLHMIGCYGDIDTMRIFTDIAMTGVHVNAKDHSGKTARQLFEERPGVTEGHESLELRQAFNELLTSVRQNTIELFEEVEFGDAIGGPGAGSESDEQEFFDAE